LTDVDEWLDPMDYIAFWEAIAPYNILSIADRDHCDGLIADGKVKADTILKGLKHVAYDWLRTRFNLPLRLYETYAVQGAKSLH
jgi:hypothetical protein